MAFSQHEDYWRPFTGRKITTLREGIFLYTFTTSRRHWRTVSVCLSKCRREIRLRVWWECRRPAIENESNFHGDDERGLVLSALCSSAPHYLGTQSIG